MDNRSQKITEMRRRRLTKMNDNDLDKLNGKLVGKGCNWCTQERLDVCDELSERMYLFFHGNAAKQLQGEVMPGGDPFTLKPYPGMQND